MWGIAEKTKVINEIVFQTKLLSFNASVEAARAGEHGKGFAVVAEEVGSLAKMSGDAANEINEMLDRSIKTVNEVTEESKKKIEEIIQTGSVKVDKGVEISQACREILTEVMNNVDAVSQLMADISSATAEQADGVKNIADAMAEIDRGTNENAESANRTSQNASDLTEQVRLLEQNVDALEGELEGNSNHPPQHSQSTHEDQKHDNVLRFSKKDKNRSSGSQSQPQKMVVNSQAVPSADDDRWEDF